MNPQTASRLIVASIAFFVALLVLNSASYVIEPGTRGLKVTLGKTQEGFLPEGFGFKSRRRRSFRSTASSPAIPSTA